METIVGLFFIFIGIASTIGGIFYLIPYIYSDIIRYRGDRVFIFLGICNIIALIFLLISSFYIGLYFLGIN